MFAIFIAVVFSSYSPPLAASKRLSRSVDEFCIPEIILLRSATSLAYP